MRRNGAALFLSIVMVLALAATGLGSTGAGQAPRRARGSTPPKALGAQARNVPGRYFVTLDAPSVAARVTKAAHRGVTLDRSTQRSLRRTVESSQEGVVGAARAAGAQVLFRYGSLVNALSIQTTPAVAAELARRPDVARIEPVAIVKRHLTSSVPFIGAPQVWEEHEATGEGVRVAVVDTGVDYTHADFGGAGTVAAYQANDPTVIEPGSFPTEKVVDGFDFIGGNYDVLDGDPSNDTPTPDPDPLDDDIDGYHGTHVAGICCGQGVAGSVGEGVAPDASILAYKVWHSGSSTADVLVAAYERASDPDQDGDMSDAVDIIQFSGGVDYGSEQSLEAVAAQQAVDLGITFVASAGNSGNDAAGGSPYITGTPSTAPGVISVAASIDQFVAQTIKVKRPKGKSLPGEGLIVHQSWSKFVGKNRRGRVFDARKVDAPSSADGTPAAADQALCKKVKGKPFDGRLVLVFKGSTGAGDCDGTTKVFRAQKGGADGVILWSGFEGAPFELSPGEHAEKIKIPAWMVDTAVGDVLGQLASPKAPKRYNTRKLVVTIRKTLSVIPGFEDRMTDFTSQGPARTSNLLKPDISAPGDGIVSAAAGTGTGSLSLGGTSMAAPHISGVAALLLQLHPDWTPEQVKAVLMNQATPEMTDFNDVGPVPASIMGAGRVRADEAADAVSMATPGSLSFGLQPLAAATDLDAQTLTVTNFDTAIHNYTVSTGGNFSDYEDEVATAQVSTNGILFEDAATFPVPPGLSVDVQVRLSVDPAAITPAEQALGLYYVFPDLDGAVSIEQDGDPGDTLRVPWHVVPLAASDNSAETGGDPLAIQIATPDSAGVDHADLFVLDAADDTTTGGEEDITHAGVRSFVGPTIGDDPVGVPEGTDPLVGLGWLDFLTNGNTPAEPISFAIRSAAVHNTTEAYEANVYIDVGNDGVFADETVGADFVLSKLRDGTTCLVDLTAPDECSATYFPDYTVFNSNLTGLVAGATDLGLTAENSQIGYSYELCTDAFSGDVPQPVCEEVGRAGNGDLEFSLDVVAPPAELGTWVCEGFFGGPSCAEPISVTGGSGRQALVLFPNNAPDENFAVLDLE